MIKILNRLKFLKLEHLIILIGLFISLSTSVNYSYKYDKVTKNFEGSYHHLMIKNDVYAIWNTAEKIRQDLKNKKFFFEALPEFKREFLPSIIVGVYYYILDKEIFENKDSQLIIKEQNFKLGLLILQTLIYYFALYILLKTLQKNILKKQLINKTVLTILILFLSLEPTINQFNSSYTNESIFMSMLIFLFCILLKKKIGYFFIILSGVIVGLMFAQRPVSIFFFVPVSIFYFLIYKNKIEKIIFFLIGVSIIMGSIGFINYKKSGQFYIISAVHQYYSYYYYFGHIIYAEEHKISQQDAKQILIKIENDWKDRNQIILDDKKHQIDYYDRKDVLKVINYRNKQFVSLVISNPLITSKLFFKKAIVGVLFAPNMINNTFYFDKSDPDSKNNPKKYYNKDLQFYFFYSSILYVFIVAGFFVCLKKIIIKKDLDFFDKFLIFNFLSAIYFILISGFWGNPKYFLPCIINFSFFFSFGANFIIKQFIKLKSDF
tara:strand:+ start:2995 stop:4467 length:1473 start_codon:yes stop_codon:yes gene_type:complete